MERPSVDEAFSALSHRIRREIIKLVGQNVEISYTDILKTLNIEDGLLNFHLRKLKKFLNVTGEGTYVLSPFGKSLYDVISSLESKMDIEHETTRSPMLNLRIFSMRVGAFLLDVAVIFVFTGLFLDSYYVDVIRRMISIDLISEGLAGSVSKLLNIFLEINFYSYHTKPHVFLAGYLIFTLLESLKGQTIGKMVLGIRVVRVDGRKPSLVDVAVRNLGKVFLLPLDVIVGVIVYGKEGYLRLFDKYVGTSVEEIYKK